MLVTCDHVMYENAEKLNVEAYNVRAYESYTDLANRLQQCH